MEVIFQDSVSTFPKPHFGHLAPCQIRTLWDYYKKQILRILVLISQVNLIFLEPNISSNQARGTQKVTELCNLKNLWRVLKCFGTLGQHLKKFNALLTPLWTRTSLRLLPIRQIWQIVSEFKLFGIKFTSGLQTINLNYCQYLSTRRNNMYGWILFSLSNKRMYMS